ncbi:uncharacterized protein LOC130140070 [Syzygium oleosum]|uniref:uncharacterized protein LOC130140070 n=1 Tax=Syzygium oleosum TaxID=219896 RepID=UPI0024B882BA|nr:uncharacterized protein LOC130140070 [Syzygium oleosum]
MVANVKYGGFGSTSVFNLTVAPDQRNTHYMVIESGPPGHVSAIAAGWTVDSQVTSTYRVSPTSVYGGEIYEIPIQIQQDRTFGNWRLRVSEPPISVGYWPEELFLNLRHGLLHVAWGGDGFAWRNGFCPPMGSGHKPDGDHDFVRATYFRRLNWGRVDGAVLPPSKNTKEVVDKSNVYALRNYRYNKGTWGYTFSFGGPADYCRG